MNLYSGTTDRSELLAKAARLAARLDLPASAVKVRALPSSKVGLALSLSFGATTVQRSCESQPGKDENLGALVQWLEDLARNHERGIEQVGEALHGDGVALVVGGTLREAGGRSGRTNLYQGEMTPQEAWELVCRSAPRMGIAEQAVWLGRDGDTALLRLDLGGGRVIEKRSARQSGARANAAAIALWMQCRARHHERGIDRDLVRVMSAYLLPTSR